ncbi:acetate--CoA ligase [Candidatus Methanodesulfokora washburnensis]|uniref:Acetyl-coenzyme A synthetase n=1 Tax=Candidatus Methanodesulfokora washburnensis TaxID=2478471 RepID=A0A429GJ11_9CREN|nr:acetate--CoA ligase [Candidatus Methanodesulfokores washburnensis]RSN73818.1 acetate--CoA ligase [Candidatus Methanodesulfokores washburnensis]
MSEATKLYMEEAKRASYGHKLRQMQELALRDPENFWSDIARNLYWFKTWERVLEWNPPFARWFAGGLINASFNCLDVHVKTGNRNKVAIFWEGEPGDRRVLTYLDLWREVCKFSNVLKDLGVKKGDRVAIYMPMVPELPVAMLACARIGAIHSVVFSGFSSEALAVRIRDSGAKILITADGAYRRGRIVQLKKTADEALAKIPSIQNVVVLRRTGSDVEMKEGRDFWWDDLMRENSLNSQAVPLESEHPLYILYTSGTTGRPKGVVHDTGGYLVWLYVTMKWVFDIKPEDIYWCTADIGWVTGHSYVVYGPLLHGATSVMYEGAPDYPAPDRWWEIIERYSVSIFYTTPTAIRMHMRFGEDWARRHDLSSLRLLGTVGEPINPEAWRWYQKVIGGGRCPIVDTWWQTETGGIMISPAPGIELVPLKPGSATLPLPGVHAEVVDESGKPAKPYEKGYLVILGPWPGMLTTLWGDPESYKSIYWSKFGQNNLNFYFDPPAVYYTGDYAMKDDDGYIWLLGRADEVLKVAGHRIGTTEVESALVMHEAVAEAAVTGKPDPVRGETIVAFVTLKPGFNPSDSLRTELIRWVGKTVGPIASPSELYFVSKLPKTRSGKIMRRLLRAVVSNMPLGDMTTLEDETSIKEAMEAVDLLRKAMGMGELESQL